MSGLYPFRAVQPAVSIKPGIAAGASTGVSIDMSQFQGGVEALITIGASDVDAVFTFEGSPADATNPCVSGGVWTAITVADICDGGSPTALSYTFDADAADYIANGYALCRIAIPCKTDFIRAVRSAGKGTVHFFGNGRTIKF